MRSLNEFMSFTHSPLLSLSLSGHVYLKNLSMFYYHLDSSKKTEPRMGGHQTKGQSNQSDKDVKNLKAKIRFLQEKIEEIMCLRETESQAYEQQLIVFALKEAEWKRESKCLRQELKRLRNKGPAEKTEKQVNTSMKEMKRDYKQDDAVTKWKKLYLEIKIELENLILRTHQEEDLLDELKGELKAKEEIIQLLQAHIAEMDQEQSRRKSEVDILRQSLRIMSQSNRSKQIAKGGVFKESFHF